MAESKRSLGPVGDEPAHNRSKRVRSEWEYNAQLDTIDRKKLDFDCEKVCSVTSSALNVYCCLVCGKYFQGRREQSPAFLHSVNENHLVFINFSTLKVYVLPNDKEIKDEGEIQLLNDIRFAIKPQYNKEELAEFPKLCYDLNNRPYMNGYVGFSNTRANGCISSILVLMAHIKPLRDFFLLTDFNNENTLESKLFVVVRKLWSPKLFKAHISADELFAYISVTETLKKEYTDPRIFLLTLLSFISKTYKPLLNLFQQSCQGKISIKTILDDTSSEENKTASAFWMLALDLPPKPIFSNGLNANDLPQVKLGELLSKFNGVKEQNVSNGIKKYRLKKLPPFLFLHYNRFDSREKTPVKERNQTLVEFPTSMELQKHKYRLLANIVHEAINISKVEGSLDKDEESKWKIQLLNSKDNKWYEIDGIHVQLKDRELLFLNEAYLQVWEKII